METRALTPEVRKRIGLPKVGYRPYRWSFAILFVTIAVTPMLISRWWLPALGTVIIGLVVIPALRRLEHQDAIVREALYLKGIETIARVVEVEPGGGSGRRDHIIRIEYFADKVKVTASVVGSPLARRGLSPGDDVIVLYEKGRPRRCLVVDRVTRARSA